MKLSLKLPFLFLRLFFIPLAVVGYLTYQNSLALQEEGESNLWFNLLFYFTGRGE